MQKYRKIIEQLFLETGVRINGPGLWDIQVRDERFYARVLKDGSLGLGESYMEGWWDCLRIDEFICRLLKGNLEDKIRGNLRTLLLYLSARIFNRQSPARAGIVARRHYDLGNDLFFSFLDPNNQYSCGYFQGTDDLTEAQRKKLDLICRKIALQPGDRVLDIGCGWGGFARYAAEQYGGDQDLEHPHLSPLHADFCDFPPTLIQVGSEEILYDDSSRLAQRMRHAGVDVTLSEYPQMWHVFQLHAGYMPEARQAVNEVAAFIRQQAE